MTEPYHAQDPQTSDNDAPAPRPRWRQRLAIATLLILILAVLILTPPLINVNRFQHRIAASISASLGRPVHLDSVTLHLLPMPGFTLTNLVVSEDPAFGSEPTIRANEVDARLRISSLWRRQVEFSEVQFINPSLNLVRNPAGRWNFESLLLHASHIDAAPTVQKHHSDVARFPYIEATSARVNIKLGEEKMPFSLTTADFALWLPTAHQWRIRLEATPARTDNNVGDPGIMRLDATFDRASTLAEVPVDLSASWHDAPLGQAGLLLSGEDPGWRGTLDADASLRGPLGASALKLRFTFDGLRRAEFVPAQPLDLALRCDATANVPAATLTNAACTVPITNAQPLRVTSSALDVQRLHAASFTLTDPTLPLRWVFDWLRLFSPRIPVDTNPQGTLAIALDRSTHGQWLGQTQLTLPDAALPPTTTSHHHAKTTEPATPLVLTFTAQPETINSCTQGLNLAPTPIHLDDGTTIDLSGDFTRCGYILHATGNASAASLTAATHLLPDLNDDLTTLLPHAGAAHLNLTCSRFWPLEPFSPLPASSTQICTAAPPPAKKKTPHRRHRR